MNPIYNAGRMIGSDNGGESVDELQRRAKLQKQLSGIRQTGMSRPSGKQQLDEILSGRQKSEPANTKSGHSASLQRASIPAPASVSEDRTADRPDDVNINEVKTFEQASSKDLQQPRQGRLAEVGSGDSARDDSASLGSAGKISGEAITQVARADQHPMDRLFDDLDIDISAFSIDDLSAYLRRLTVSVQAAQQDRSASDLMQSAEEQALASQRVSHKELLAALDFMEGYAESLFRQHTDRKQLDQSFNALREQINLDQSRLVQHLAPAPEKNTLSAQLGGEVGRRVLATHQTKSSVRDSFRKSEEARTGELDSEMEALAAIAAQTGRENRIAESTAVQRSNHQRKQKEKDDTTLPLIVQRSA